MKHFNKNYWKCKCITNCIHSKNLKICPICKMKQTNQQEKDPAFDSDYLIDFVNS